MLKEDLLPLIREFPDRSIQWLLETPDNVRGLLLIVATELAKQIDIPSSSEKTKLSYLTIFRNAKRI